MCKQRPSSPSTLHSISSEECSPCTAGRTDAQVLHDTPVLIPPTLICDYMENMYPFYPVVDQDEVQVCYSSLQTDASSAAFIYALAAATIAWTHCRVVSDAKASGNIEDLIARSLQSSGSTMDPGHPSVITAMTPLLIQIALASLGRREAAWFHLRQACTLVQLLNYHDARCETILDLHETSRRQRLYWMALIHERFLSVRLGLPAMLGPMPSPPSPDPRLPENIQHSFSLICRMFQLMDADFFTRWLSPGEDQDGSTQTLEWISNAQTELDKIAVTDSNNATILSDKQTADIVITQLWMHVLFWQLAIRTCPLPSDARDMCLSLRFPLRLTRHLARTIRTLAKEDIESHGASMVHKLLELLIAIVDVVNIAGLDSYHQGENVLSDLELLIFFIVGLDRLDERQKELLHLKLDQLSSRHPSLSYLAFPHSLLT